VTQDPAVGDELPVSLLAAVARSSGSVHFLDAATLRTERTIVVGRGPHDVAVSSDGRIAIVPLLGIYPAAHDEPVDVSELNWRSEASEGYAVFDPRSDTVAARHRIDNCKRPHGAAMNAQAGRVWITCEDVGEIREIDPRDGKTMRTFRMANGL
jgi:DNA-binding beta-propeller fold protein YncE